MTIEKIQFTHQAYIECIKLSTYHFVPVFAIQRGTLKGCWEKLIGDMLKAGCMNQNPAAFKTMEELGFEVFTDDCWTQAGEMILSNEKIEV